MDELKLKFHTYTFVPTDYVADETRKVMDIKRGTWVLGVVLRVGVQFNQASTISIGDKVGGGHGDIDGFMTTAQAAINAAAGLRDGYGAYFSASNGRLYSEVDTVTDSRNTIDITYVHVDATTVGEVTVIITYVEVE